MFQPVWFASLPQLLILYFIELVTLLYLLRKYSKSTLYVFFILLFYPAIFTFIGKNFQDIYKIIMLAFTLWECNKRKVFTSFVKGDWQVSVFFIAFSFSYAISAIENNDSWTIILSQYSRYVIAYCLWFLVRKELFTSYSRTSKLTHLAYELVLIQIIISIGKLFIFEGQQIESIVGSLTHIGGADGTVLPILGFVVLWFYKRGKFNKMDFLFVAGLILIGFLAGKRAIWFILPGVIAAFMIYIPRLKINMTLMIAILILPIALSLGIRLTPTLNPENKVWGSFNPEFAFNYAKNYQFGDKKHTNDKKSQGRSGATFALLYKWKTDNAFTVNDWVGIGMSKMYGTDYGEFEALNLGLNHKGSATGVFQSYVTNGYLGILTTVLLFFSMLWQVNMRRIRLVLIAIVAWEYFFYTGIIFRTPAYMFLIVYFIHYSNILKYRPKKLIVDNIQIRNSIVLDNS